MKFLATALTTLLVSTSVRADRPTEGACYGESTHLDFFNSVLTDNTLHLAGGALRYSGIGTEDGQDLDLVVSIYDGDYTDIAQVWVDRGKTNAPNLHGLKPGAQLGNINLQTVIDKPKSGEAKLRFCLVKSGTDEEFAPRKFAWATWDLDERLEDTGSNGIGIKEKLTMDTAQTAQWFFPDSGIASEVEPVCEDGTALDSLGLCPPGIRTIFKSSKAGIGPDNPRDLDNLNDLQLSRAIVFVFEDTACWDLDYDHYCPVDQPDYDGPLDPGGALGINNCRTYTGGNFLFSGFACPSIPEPPCPADVEVYKMDGVTEIDATAAVTILRQDTTSVTVALNQAWTTTDTVDSIFYNYHLDGHDYSQHCFAATDVAGQKSAYEEITLQCYHTKPFAELDICVADHEAVQGSAEIPKCCDADVPAGTPVVCYTLTINCETACVEATDRRRALRGRN